MRRSRLRCCCCCCGGGGGCERASATVEALLVVPVVVLMLLFVVAFGRLGETREDVEGAARDAARAASLARSAPAARAAAAAAAATALAAAGASCASHAVAVDASRFAPGGAVAVEVRCSADLSDATGLGLPGTKELSARSVAVVDFHRGLE